MKRLLITLVLGLVLGLVGGVGIATASPLPPPSEVTGVAQEATQSNDGSNSADQTATSLPSVTNTSPNTAVENGGSACNPGGPTGGGHGDQKNGPAGKTPGGDKPQPAKGPSQAGAQSPNA